LICIYTLSTTHYWWTIIITGMLCCICSICIFISRIWSRYLFTYFIASLILPLMNAALTLVICVLYVVLVISTHYSLVVFYFRTVLNVIGRVHLCVHSVSRLQAIAEVWIVLLRLIHHRAQRPNRILLLILNIRLLLLGLVYILLLLTCWLIGIIGILGLDKLRMIS
jgi:hypothetical protein